MKLNNNSASSTADVGSLGPNSLGLYDTRGNVWAWCLDSHDPAVHVLRGGAWDTTDEPSSRIVFRWYKLTSDWKTRDWHCTSCRKERYRSKIKCIWQDRKAVTGIAQVMRIARYKACWMPE